MEGLCSRDDHIATLADANCRETLGYLQTRTDSTTSLSALACERSGVEQGGRSDAATRLHHVTLPKLEAAGLVAYDSAERTVTYRQHDDVETTLEWFDGGC